MIDIFTDGSTINNGKKNALGGIGVYIPNININYLTIFIRNSDKSEM